MMDNGTITSVTKDSEVMHDFITEFYEGHEYRKDGLVIDNINALIALTKLRSYISDIIGEEDE